MRIELSQKPKWQIDCRLEALIGRDVRVAARAFSPTSSTDEAPLCLTPVDALYLPDNSQPGGLVVFFEGRLRSFERAIGVVLVGLDSPSTPEAASEGTQLVRGRWAVILRGPAVVQLAFPFQVEPLPADPDNYWLDLRTPLAQFELPFAGLPSPASAEEIVREYRTEQSFHTLEAVGKPSPVD